MLYKIFLPVCFCFWSSFYFVCIAQDPKLVLPVGHSAWVDDARFSPDNKLILTASDDHTAKIWDAKNGVLLYTLEGHTSSISSIQFSPDGKMIATGSGDATCRLWETATGKLLKILSGHERYISTVQFSPDGQSVLTSSGDNSFRVWDVNTGKEIFEHTTEEFIRQMAAEGVYDVKAKYSPDGKKILSYSQVYSAEVWDVATQKAAYLLEGGPIISNAVFSNDEKWLITDNISSNAVFPEIGDYPGRDTVKVWNANTGKLFKSFKIAGDWVNSIQFSPDGKTIAACTRSAITIINTSSWQIIDSIKIDFGYINTAEFSPGSLDKHLLTADKDRIARIWDAATGRLLTTMEGILDDYMYASLKFSPDGKKVISSSNNNNGTVWDAATGKLLFNLKTQGQINALHSVVISPNDKWILIVMENGSINLWEAATGKIINSFTGYHPFVWENNYADFVLINHPRYTQFSPDEKFIITYQNRDTACLWDVKTCQFLCSFTKEGKQLKVAANKNILFDKGQKKILVITGSDTASLDLSKLGLHDISLSGSDDQKLVDYTGREPITEWKSAELKHFNFLNCGEGSCSPYLGEIGICFAHHSNWAVTVSNDNTIKIRDTTSGKILYSFLSIDSSDYLAVDNAGHYDGTQAARKLLYFTCGLEVISLDQVKDQLWVPNLIERINNKEIINAKTLNELNICGLTPEVKEVSSNPDEYYFTIKPRRGGLGDLNLSINGVVADTRKPEQLTKKDDVYELRIIKKDFIPYLPDGQINKISLKVYTADNAISSQEITITIDKTEKPTPPPSLFAVMVGVSDYKGEAMDLDFAAIDATDVSNALKDAAGKLLGKEHVFMYNLTTAKDHYLLPEKNSIKKVLEEIGEKATANDILFIFLSGHGVMEGEGKKLFYYMTADAADFDAYTVAGISTTELTEWIKPQNIKAQKRILILDACHSGQAINDFVKLGDDKLGIPASKGDGKAQQIKAIDKLNEKSGLFILSASASDKSAFESKIHSHGYLTYSLLKAIKEQPDILEDGKFLNISRWFNAAGKTVSEVAKEEGVGQQTQIVSNTDFNIGLVDDEVMGNIKLPEGTLVFSASNFQNNDVAADGDDLEMSRTINQSLQESSSNEIIYSATASSANAYSLSGRYDVKDNTVTISFSIKKNNKTLFRFEKEAGPKDKLRELADTVVTKAVEWVISNKENK